ncbi:MAG: hypothetical protein NC124_11060 [Clostridium sp.]|nr:hypothetical protein [Clostridium sp.]
MNEYIIGHAMEVQCFNDTYINTNSEEIKNYVRERSLLVIERLEILAKNTANGFLLKKKKPFA